MGYLGNHLATMVTGVFAATLTGLWPFFIDFAPILNFVFVICVPITWFLTFTCWISQKSNDYMYKSKTQVDHSEKKSLSNLQTTQIYTSNGKQVSDTEIERLNQEISNLQTLVQIESLKTELANLKMLAFGSKTKNK